jgi:hypothetical protein
MDCDHAESLKGIILSHCSTMDDRMAFVHCTEIILDARVASYDAMGRISSKEVVDRCRSLQRKDRYARTAILCSFCTVHCTYKPICIILISLSGLNCNPMILDMMEDQVKGAKVLVVGCGDGVTSRNITAMGAKKVVGVDIR